MLATLVSGEQCVCTCCTFQGEPCTDLASEEFKWLAPDGTHMVRFLCARCWDSEKQQRSNSKPVELGWCHSGDARAVSATAQQEAEATAAAQQEANAAAVAQQEKEAVAAAQQDAEAVAAAAQQAAEAAQQEGGEPQPPPQHADATLRRQLAVVGVLQEAKISYSPLSVLTRRARRIAAFTERRAALVASLAKTYDLGTSLALGEVNNEIRNRFIWLDALTEPSYPGDDPEQFAKWGLFELDAFSGLRPLVGAFGVGPTIGVESQQQEVVGKHLLPTKAYCTKCSSWCCTDSICSNGMCIPCCMDVECCQCWAKRRLAGVCINPCC